MAYKQENLSPYSSYVLARRQGAIKDLDDEIDRIMVLAMTAVQDAIERPRRVTDNHKVAGVLSSYDFIDPWEVQKGLKSMACVYTEERPVTWLSSSAEKDKIHHLLMITASTNRLMLLTATDSEHRAELLYLLQSDYFSPWETVSQPVLVKALVENQEMKTLWLAGVHRDTLIKPSSKILSGSDLREAIDPMNDSSYLAGAVRSKEAGVSLRNSSVWTGPNATLEAFEDRTKKLLTALQMAIRAKPAIDLQVHAGLAQQVNSINGVEKCYFIAHVDPEALEAGSGKKKAAAFTDRFHVELATLGAPTGTPAWGFSALVTDVASRATRVIKVVPELVGHRDRVAYTIAPLPPAPFDEWASSIVESPSLLRAYYESGHTIAASALSMVRSKDSRFDGFEYCNFTNYNVDQEKPKKANGVLVPIQNMTTTRDKSLFKWIFKDGLTLLGLNAPSPNKCWLYCDDGSSEVADFVHLDIGSTPKRLTLIHAKGASSKKATRRAAPGPYELVAAQAIKNLRAFDSEQLISRIGRRLKENGKDRIWDQAWKVNIAPMSSANDFENALSQLGVNHACEVIIVQPHVRKSDYMKAGQQSMTVGASQLRTLLSSVESLARAVNAKFRVVVDDK